MKLLQLLLKKTNNHNDARAECEDNVLLNGSGDSWQKLPGYIPADKQEHQIVSLIASVIAAGDKPYSQFVVKNIMKRNSELLQVSLIASSLIQTTDPDVQIKIKKICKKVD
ncbi:hypothetical protein [Enterococcus cecorum]|uniref:Uncharacterized protein n=1 Tax=Enterococcus cecorum TaxID=44008 RepID=A0A366SDV8_9ENTE|nr:hypothetical protein [Enterococcus cecorum]RBR27895.1 hypothetical protein EB18_02005 [Enterococcus cecorum]